MDIKMFSIFLGFLLGAVNALLGWILIKKALEQKQAMKWLQAILGSMLLRMVLVLGAFIVCIFTLNLVILPFAISFLVSILLGLTLDAYWIIKKVKS